MSNNFVNGWRQFLIKHQVSNQRKSMKDMLWERRENWKVDRLIYNRILLEGRLEDVKKKYQEHFPEDIIDKLSRNDPSGNNKYLAHMVKLLLKYGKSYEERGPDVPAYTLQQYSNTAGYIGGAVQKFHKLNKHIPAEKGGRDIHSYKTIEDLEQAVRNAEAIEAKKEAEKVHKEKIRADADRIYQDKTTLVVRPGSEEASCYYGQGTKWCISATEAQNYWDDYVDNQGAVFFFILDKEMGNEEEEFGIIDRGKVAFVYDGHHLIASEPWDAYDEADDQLDATEALRQYESFWGEEKWMEVVSGIQQSLEDDPPEEGIDLDTQGEELAEYARTQVDENLPALIEFSIYGDNDEGMRATAEITFDIPMGWDTEDPAEQEKYPGSDDNEAIEISYHEAVDTDYHDIEYEFDFTNVPPDIGPTLRIETRMACEDCGAYEPDAQGRQRVIDNTKSFIDDIVNNYAEDYDTYKEDLRRELVVNKVIAPSEWEVRQKDIFTDIEDLELDHFMLHEYKVPGEPAALLYMMVKDNGEAPEIGSYAWTNRDEILFPVMKANSVPDRGYYSPEFDRMASAAINKYLAEAHKAAEQQLELPLGAKYKEKESKDFEDPSVMVYLKDGALREKQFRGSVQVTFTKIHTPEDIKADMAYMVSLNKHYDDIVEELKKVYNDITVKHREEVAGESREILDGTRVHLLIRSIDDRIVSEPEDVRNNIVEVLKWFKDNFDKMNGVEKYAAVKYLSYIEMARGDITVYLDDKDVPLHWKKYVSDELERRGASHMQKSQYRWKGKRDDIVESVRNRIRQVIAENLKR